MFHLSRNDDTRDFHMHGFVELRLSHASNADNSTCQPTRYDILQCMMSMMGAHVP